MFRTEDHLTQRVIQGLSRTPFRATSKMNCACVVVMGALAWSGLMDLNTCRTGCWLVGFDARVYPLLSVPGTALLATGSQRTHVQNLSPVIHPIVFADATSL